MDKLLRIAESRITRQLTAEEQEKYGNLLEQSLPCSKWDGRYKWQDIVLGAVLTVGNDGGFLAINNKGGTVVANVGSGDQGEGLLSCKSRW